MSFNEEIIIWREKNLNLSLIGNHLLYCFNNLTFYVYFSNNLSLFSVEDMGQSVFCVSFKARNSKE